MRPPAPVLPSLTATLLLTAAIALAYVVAGWLHDLALGRRARKLARTHAALSVVLFHPEAEAAAAAERVAETSRNVLLDIAQSLANDLDGEADKRLRRLVGSAGLNRQIRARVTSRSWRKRVQGAALASLLPSGDPDRVRLLGDEHPTVRARAAESMEGADVVAHVDRLLDLLDDPVQAVRFAAQQALLRSDNRIVPALQAHLTTSQGAGVTWALEIAANLPDPRLLPAIEHHLTSPDAERRAIATEAIVPWLDDPTPLVPLFSDSSAEVRATAARAAGNAGAEILAAHVGRLLRDQAWQVRQEAGRALVNMGPTGVMTLRIHREDEDPYARDMAVLMLDTMAAHDRRVVAPSAVASVAA